MAKDRYKWAKRFTHSLGNHSARRFSYYLNDLFSIPGNEGILRALQMTSSISDQNLKDRITQAIIYWAGNPANEIEARKQVNGYAYISAILAFDRFVLSRNARLKAFVRNYLQVRSEKAQRQLEQIRYVLHQNKFAEAPLIPKQIQVLLLSNAPAIAPNSTSNHSI